MTVFLMHLVPRRKHALSDRVAIAFRGLVLIMPCRPVLSGSPPLPEECFPVFFHNINISTFLITKSD